VVSYATDHYFLHDIYFWLLDLALADAAFVPSITPN
jgi:hypothetical protein